MAVEFNKSDLERMQNDAVRRVRDMQARAQQRVGGQQQNERENPPPKKEPSSQKPQHRDQHNSQNNSSIGKGLGGLASMFSSGNKDKSSNSILNLINLKGLDLDGDTSLIALMILLLSSDKGDELLMLALVYILL